MSRYCTCCDSDIDWAGQHWSLSDVDTSWWTRKEWLREAEACREFWAGQGEPLDCTVEELARLLAEANE
jgi:hypothetical protein